MGNFTKGSLNGTCYVKKDTDKNSYFGECKDGKKDGYGTWFYQGVILNGTFEDDEFKDGSRINSRGEKYTGPMNSKIKPEGDGETHRKYSIHKGKYVDGKAEGLGNKTWKKSQMIYDGNYADDLEDGEGVLTWKKYKLRLKTIKYEGNFEKGRPKGKCKITIANKFSYEGEYDPDTQMFKGKSKEAEEDPIISFRFNFRKGKIAKEAKLVYVNGNIYTGGFQGVTKEGNGTLIANNEFLNKYVGPFKNDLPNGKGVAYLPAYGVDPAEVHLFEFKNGKQSGYGQIFYPDDEIKKKCRLHNWKRVDKSWPDYSFCEAKEIKCDKKDKDDKLYCYGEQDREPRSSRKKKTQFRLTNLLDRQVTYSKADENNDYQTVDKLEKGKSIEIPTSVGDKWRAEWNENERQHKKYQYFKVKSQHWTFEEIICLDSEDEDQ